MDELHFQEDRDLYEDKSYFETIAGGFNSFGIGSAVASISFGWNRSLRSFQLKKVKGSITPLSHICSEEEVVVIGYPTFTFGFHEEKYNGIQMNLQMHGANWIPAVIHLDRQKQQETMNWTIVYFREDGLSLPKEWFDKLTQPVNIFGEILRFPMANRPCVVKARAAGVILSDNRGGRLI